MSSIVNASTTDYTSFYLLSIGVEIHFNNFLFSFTTKFFLIISRAFFAQKYKRISNRTQASKSMLMHITQCTSAVNFLILLINN